jgi:hypothetical protein
LTPTKSGFNPNTEVENRAHGNGFGGAQHLRRFNVRLVLAVRAPTALWPLKRPEGRAPNTSSQPISELGFKAKNEGQRFRWPSGGDGF